ncbi:hypothetical protein [Vibrio barjaei]|uniref:hypothetical protein n=1 Tax=Vibrio barjaei TaxID=1676683 RepID=UPI00228410EC|nr:hypothetical protein [Vibrio barjaei]MCY9874020.1 hypothetical protein [Vibrio barjaei]
MSNPIDIDPQDDIDVAALKEHPEFQDEFGVSRVQRYLRWGYNRAARACERAIASQVIVQCYPNDYQMRFNKDK